VPRLVGCTLQTLAVNAGNLCRRIAELVERQRLHVILQIGARLVAIGAGEQAELRWRHGERPRRNNAYSASMPAKPMRE